MTAAGTSECKENIRNWCIEFAEDPDVCNRRIECFEDGDYSECMMALEDSVYESRKKKYGAHAVIEMEYDYCIDIVSENPACKDNIESCVAECLELRECLESGRMLSDCYSSILPQYLA